MRFAATRQLIVALLVLAVRSQQLYTVHYRTVVANAVPKGISARDAALLVEPMAVRFAGALNTDLSELAHLDEPNILRALTLRFGDDSIYTACGPILVAVNPWKRIAVMPT